MFWFQESSFEELSPTANTDPAPYIYTGRSTNTDSTASENRDSIAANSRESNAADIYCEAEVDGNFGDTRDDER